MEKSFVKESWLIASILAFLTLMYGVVFVFEQGMAI